MATAIPAAIGVGGSIIRGIQGKGEAKRQEKEAERLRQMLAPLVQQQMQGLQFAQQQGQQLFPQATNAINTVFNQATGTFEPLMKDYRQMLADATSSQGKFNAEGDALMGEGKRLTGLSEAEMMGAISGLGDLEKAYRPFMQGGATAFEKFLPSQATLQKLMAGDFANINQGYKSASENIARFAPKTGRTSTLAQMDVQRQGDITRALSQGRQAYGQQAANAFFQAGEGTRGALTGKAQIGQGLGQLGLGKIGAGQQSKQQGIADFGAKSGAGLQQLQAALQALGIGAGAAGNLGQLAGSTMSLGTQGGGNIFDMVNQQQNRAYGPQPVSNPSKGLGGFLVDMFNTPGAQNWMSGIFGGGKTAGAGAPMDITKIK